MKHRSHTALLLGLFLMAGIAMADELALDLDLPAGNLATSVETLAKQAGINVLFDRQLMEGKQTPALKGNYTPRAALQQLLSGSGIEFSFTAENTVSIAPATTNRGALKEVVVTATRTERSIYEVPASVNVLTGKTLAAKNRQNIFDALRDVESLDFVAQQSVGHQVTPSIRGMSTQVLVDGVALDSIVSQVMGRGGLNFTSLQDVERIEVMHGPASALYGPNTVGGVINVLPKRWKGASGAEVNATYGTHNTQTVGAAIGTAKENFDVRLSAYDAKSDGYKSNPTTDLSGQYDLAPKDWKDNKIGLMTGFRPTDNHELIFSYQQYATRSVAYGGRLNNRSDLDGDSTSIGYRYDWSADTNIKVNFRSTKLEQKYTFDRWYWTGVLTTPGTVAATDLALFRYGGRNSDSKFFQAMLQTRPFNGNELILGYSRDTGDFEQYSAVVSSGARTVTGSKSKIDGLFVQDEQRFGFLALTAGIRQDRIGLSPDTINGVPKNGSDSVANVVNPRLGARFHLTDATSFYASYGTAYVPALNLYRFVQPSTTRVDNPDLKPETSTTYEVGMNNRMTIGTLRTALYHTNYKDKIAYGTDASTGRGQYQNLALVKVDGVEVAYQGDLGGGWQPYANYSYNKSRDYAKSGAPGTQTLRMAPHRFNAGMTYASGDTWSATLNARHVSGLYFNNLTQAQWADGHIQVDAKIGAALPMLGNKWEGFLAVNNLTDKKYETFNKLEWSDGRTFTIGLDGKF